LAVPAFFYHVFLFHCLYLCPTCMYHFCICSTASFKLLTVGRIAMSSFRMRLEAHPYDCTSLFSGMWHQCGFIDRCEHFLPWRWRQLVSLKHWQLSIVLHCVMC
jgi:hypothetical protein